MLGCIPIVKRTYMGQGLYDGLPVLYVTDWNHITPELLESEWKKYVEAPPGTYKWERLFAPYWVDRVRNSTSPFQFIDSRDVFGTFLHRVQQSFASVFR